MTVNRPTGPASPDTISFSKSISAALSAGAPSGIRNVLRVTAGILDMRHKMRAGGTTRIKTSPVCAMLIRDCSVSGTSVCGGSVLLVVLTAGLETLRIPPGSQLFKD